MKTGSNPNSAPGEDVAAEMLQVTAGGVDGIVDCGECALSASDDSPLAEPTGEDRENTEPDGTGAPALVSDDQPGDACDQTRDTGDEAIVVGPVCEGVSSPTPSMDVDSNILHQHGIPQGTLLKLSGWDRMGLVLALRAAVGDENKVKRPPDPPPPVAMIKIDPSFGRQINYKRLANDFAAQATANLRLTFVTLLGRSLDMLRCTPTEAGALLSRDPNSMCWTGLQAAMLPVVIIPLVCYTAMTPLIYLCVLWRAHTRGELYTPDYVCDGGGRYTSASSLSGCTGSLS